MEFLFGLIVNAVVWVPPMLRLLDRAGMNRNLAWISVIPLAGIVLVWVLAFRPGAGGRTGV